VAVVGGGIVGAAAALFLAERGASVVLVEARRVAGNVLYRLTDPRIAEAVELLRAVQADLQQRRSATLGMAG
jgi:glycine/D-amino acid oxidase-like deaminating enzyme